MTIDVWILAICALFALGSIGDGLRAVARAIESRKS